MVWLVGDMDLKLTGDRNSRVKQAWNETVTDEDLVLIVGNLGNLSFEELDNFFGELKGRKRILVDSTKGIDKEKYKNIYFTPTEGFSKNESIEVRIPKTKENFEIYKSHNYYVAAPRSISGEEKVYNNRILSISIDDWELYPISYERLPQIVENMESYEKMEVEEVQ